MTATAAASPAATVGSGADGGRSASGGRRAGLQLLFGAVLLLAVLAIALNLFADNSSKDPLSPRSSEPDGAKALVDLIRELGNDVSVNRSVPNGAEVETVVVLERDLSADQLAELEGWVERGGRAVVIGRFAAFSPRLGRFLDAGPDGEIAAGSCDIASLADLGGVRLADDGGFSGSAESFERAGGDRGCFGDEFESLVISRERGLGRVVSVAPQTLVTNRLLDEADNAAVAVGVIAPRLRTPVHFLEPDPEAPPADLGDPGVEGPFSLIPNRAWRAAALLGLAGLVLIAHLSRRLGKPVSETLPVAIEGSELVSAVGLLLERSNDPARSAGILRQDVRRLVVRRLGLPPEIDHAALVAVAAERLSLPEAEVNAVLADGGVETDADLVVLVRNIETVRSQILGTSPMNSPAKFAAQETP